MTTPYLSIPLHSLQDELETAQGKLDKVATAIRRRRGREEMIPAGMLVEQTRLQAICKILENEINVRGLDS